MTEYEIKLSHNHFLINDGNVWLLVDTGGNSSFCETGQITLCGKRFPVPTFVQFYAHVDAEYVSNNVGEHVSGLIGMDILRRFAIKFDLPAGKLTFGCPTDGLTRVSPGAGTGYVSMDMTINGHRAHVLLDSGAPVSYVSPFLTEGLESVGTKIDFSPLTPNSPFETPIFEFPAIFAGNAFSMQAGHLPKDLEQQVSGHGFGGAVGFEVLSRFPLVLADGSVWV
jgi:hypothetical protein